MAGKFFEQVGGTIKVRLRGKNQETLINMASTRGIYIWDIKKQGEELDMKVRSSGLKALQNLADDHDFELDIREKQGLPFYKNIFRRRMVFLGGGLFFIIALYLLSSFIWSVDVSGNKQVTSKRIILAAARHGVYQGAAKWNFSRSQVEEDILNDIEEICYVKLDIRGVRARIQVVEKIIPLKEINGPRNMVASKDGMVEEMLVLEGQPRVKEGDVVARGDILISGMVFPEPSPYLAPEEQVETEPAIVKARGEVKAKVWYQGYGECRLRTEKMLPGTGKQKRLWLITPWKEIGLRGGNKSAFKYYDHSMVRHTIKTPWGTLGFKSVLIREKIKKVNEYSEDEALARATRTAMQMLRHQLGPRAKINHSQVKVLSSPSEPILRVKVLAESQENIAVAQPINTEAE